MHTRKYKLKIRNAGRHPAGEDMVRFLLNGPAASAIVADALSPTHIIQSEPAKENRVAWHSWSVDAGKILQKLVHAAEGEAADAGYKSRITVDAQYLLLMHPDDMA